MAVQDDLRRLTQVDSIYLGYSVLGMGPPFTSWFKGRLQQANDGSWILRSVSSDGAVSGFQLGTETPNWTSSEAPNTGITVTIPIWGVVPVGPIQNMGAVVYLQQQLPQELTN
jgi:hypothetical protein